MKNILRAGAGIVLAITIAMPFAAGAVSADELQIKIQALLKQVAALQAQIRVVQTGTPEIKPADSAVSSYRVCALLNRNLASGEQGDDVMGLQEFLAGEGYFAASATGYYGPVTASAVAKWQAAQGVSSVGSVGPLTRERIKVWCNKGNGALSFSPQTGSAPLTVTFVSMVGDGTGRPSFVDGQDTMLDFGDGTEPQWVSCGNDDASYSMTQKCSTPVKFTHTYSQNGTYVAKLQKQGGHCIGTCQVRVIAEVKIQVGDTNPIACTKEYKPVCGSKQVVCITAPCNPVQTTYGNSCMLKADGAAYLYEGQCKADTTNPESNPQCKSWYDGCNTCSRSTSGGPAMCTLRACTAESMAKPYCTSYFESTSNKPPTISGISGPSTLSLNETGTWSIQASDPEGGALSYSIWWGDENVYAPSMNSGSAMRDFIQTSSFTHSYANTGTYTVTVLVRDASGAEAKTSTTVHVGGTAVACTMQYDPVCGRPAGCMNSCPSGMYCAMMCQQHPAQTYGNRCMLDASGAEFMYSGQCTGAQN